MIVYEDVDLAITSNIKVIIPSIMTSDMSKTDIHQLKKAIYVSNDVPNVKNNIRSQKYLTATINSNSLINDMKKNSIGFSYVLKKGDVIRGKFLNNKINKLSYTITGLTKG